MDRWLCILYQRQSIQGQCQNQGHKRKAKAKKFGLKAKAKN